MSPLPLLFDSDTSPLLTYQQSSLSLYFSCLQLSFLQLFCHGGDKVKNIQKCLRKLKQFLKAYSSRILFRIILKEFFVVVYLIRKTCSTNGFFYFYCKHLPGESSSSTRSEDLEAAVLEILKFDITTEQLEKCLSNGYTIQDMKMQLLQNKTNKKRIDKPIDSMTKTQKD